MSSRQRRAGGRCRAAAMHAGLRRRSARRCRGTARTVGAVVGDVDEVQRDRGPLPLATRRRRRRGRCDARWRASSPPRRSGGSARWRPSIAWPGHRPARSRAAPSRHQEAPSSFTTFARVFGTTRPVLQVAHSTSGSCRRRGCRGHQVRAPGGSATRSASAAALRRVSRSRWSNVEAGRQSLARVPPWPHADGPTAADRAARGADTRDPTQMLTVRGPGE